MASLHLPLFISYSCTNKYIIGDCDNDDECEGDLICGKRRNFDEIPGCIGPGRDGKDYCRYTDDVLNNQVR